MAAKAAAPSQKKGGMLDVIEKVGNKVPHPVLMFLYLIIFIAVLSHILHWMGVSVTEDIAVPVPKQMLQDLSGALFVTLEYYSAVTAAASPAATGDSGSLSLYIGILVDLVIDGAVIGIGSSLTLETGLLLALGLAVGTLPLAFVTISTAKRQGMPPERRKQLSYLFIACMIGGAALGFLLLRGQPLGPKMVVIALASGFLITTVTQSMIPEANRDGEPSFAGILYMGGLSIYALSTLALN